MSEDKKQWWTEAYEQMQELGYDYHYIDFASAEKEIEFIERTLDLSKGNRVLDLGCGNGRHSILLAERGYQVIGIDYSNSLLEMAKVEAGNRGLNLELRQQDMLTLDENSLYDGVIILDGSFGIFTDSENEEVLKRVSKALKPGGKLLLQSYNPYYMALNQGRDAEVEGDRTFIRETSFDIERGAVIDNIISLDNITGKYKRINTRYYRAYTIPELARISDKYSLGNLKIYGHDDEFCPKLELFFDVQEDMVMYIILEKLS
ncbi:hypothetical protein U472_09320 [Orenia metallireducens]|jgi:cyclopropane fatty-acyl-phospholipid synthase-like methyltransferase|uniref:Methyltransferase domain-containing protein n=1 Tax=Orenia metallireducens TaxID=1413210 RepID=A0A1C0A7J6_9FIRM|nr:class I SAM-dependent methyltransferase [Orenia metallireducens]OCL26202.1 hypothetical protein U472_09320 [Orenia metallireducens]